MSRANPAMLEINKAIAQIAEQCHKITRLQADGLIDAEACGVKIATLNAKLTELRIKRRNIMQNDNVNEQIEIIQQTIDIITDGPEELEGFDEKLFTDLVEQIIAESQTRIRFRLYGGIELTENVKGAGRWQIAK